MLCDRTDRRGLRVCVRRWPMLLCLKLEVQTVTPKCFRRNSVAWRLAVRHMRVRCRRCGQRPLDRSRPGPTSPPATPHPSLLFRNSVDRSMIACVGYRSRGLLGTAISVDDDDAPIAGPRDAAVSAITVARQIRVRNVPSITRCSKPVNVSTKKIRCRRDALPRSLRTRAPPGPTGQRTPWSLVSCGTHCPTIR